MKLNLEMPASRKIMALTGLIFTAFVFVSLAYETKRIHEHMTDKALLEARTIFELNIAYRKWSAGYGGVYIPITKNNQPNPHLSMHPKRDLVAADGTRLTLVNPAMMSRQVNDILSSSSALPLIIRVTSLKYINFSNAPDDWEIQALRSFEAGSSEVNEMATIHDQPYMRLIKPFITDQGCLDCHAAQGYQLGDIRGGLSLGVPMKPFLESAARERKKIVLSHLLVWLIGMAGIGGLGFLLQKADRNTSKEREFTETAINSIRGTFVVLDDKGRYVRWNKAAEEAWGLTADDLKGRDFLPAIHPDDRPYMAAKIGEMLEKGFAEAEVRRLVHGSEEPRNYIFSGRKMVVEGKSYLVGTGLDITERKNMEEKVRAASAEWTTTFDAINDCIIILDRECRIVTCNAATVKLVNRPMEQLIGRHCWELMHEGRRPAACPVTRLLAGKTRETAVMEVLGKTCLITADPLLDGAGNVQKIVHTISDITQQRKLEAELHQAQKMEAVGALAGGVAHDFNNILSAIIGFASLLRQKTPTGDPLRQYVEPILLSAERATALTRTLLSFSRKEKAELKPVDVNQVICGFQKILTRLIGEDIEFAVHVFPGTLTVEADKGQLEQVLMNFVTNAKDAMPKGGRLAISTEEVVLEGRYGDMRSGSYAIIAVSDTGIGMDKATQEHIFEPFYTTKEPGKGTGLGLAIVYGIIRKHNGSIHVYSEKGLGTTFKILLPLMDSAPAEDRDLKEQRALPMGTETILLAEDDVSARNVAKILLEENGYTVLEAEDGEAALALFGENRDRIHLLLADLIMPKKNGRELYEEIRKIRPGIKAVFMSGYTSEVLAQKGILEEGMSLISKPLTPSELFGKVRKALK